MNLSAQEYLAKLLAKENLSVQHGNYSTASFDVLNRVLRLPLWADKGKDVYDLLVGHEVGHALFTPADGWHDSDKKFNKIPKAYLNIVEDIRIERKIQETYPGIKSRFKAGYKRLFDDDLFGTVGKDTKDYGLMDRLNISSKSRGIVPVEFADDESPLINEAMHVQTWDDVVVVCQKLYDFIQAKKEKEEEEQPMESSKDEGPTTESSGESSQASGDQEPAESEQNGEGNSDGEDSGEKTEETKEAAPEGHETLTDDAQRENEDDLLEKKHDSYDGDKQSQYSAGMSDASLSNIAYTYAEAKEQRDSYLAELGESIHCPYTSFPAKEDWNDTKKTYKTQANLIAKDFERKKAAFEYSRATTAKSGKLDPLKMHSYKYSEDIFLTTTNLAQAKSHGIVMYLDLSGSMCDIIEDVVAQAITIAMFCRQVNVPFEAYSFTTTAYWREVGKGIKDMPIVESEVDSKFTKVVEMFSSKMNKKTFDEAAYTMFAIGKAHSMSRSIKYHLYSHQMHALDMMGSTPLVQTCFLAAKQVKEFTRKHAIQNTNIMFLTDGQPDGVYVHSDEKADVITHRSHKIIKFGNKTIEGSSSRNLYEAALIRLKEITGATVMGFHLATDASSFGSGYHGVHESKDFSDVIKTWRKDNFSEWKNAKGYDNYFIIKINKSARFDTDEFTPRKADTIGDLKREFKKFNKTKKGNKQLVARITDAVAA